MGDKVLILLYVLLAWLVVAPVYTLLHELGHAVVALLLTDGPVDVQLGQRGWKRWKKRGRLMIVVYLGSGALWGVTLCGRWNSIPRMRRFWICLGGPAASLLVTALLVRLAIMADWARPWPMLVAAGLVQLLITIIPWHHPRWTGVMKGLPGDVLKAWHLVRPWWRSA
jgi:uncharacterized oligopeptide transporter (OPT) family protein